MRMFSVTITITLCEEYRTYDIILMDLRHTSTIFDLIDSRFQGAQLMEQASQGPSEPLTTS